MRVASKKRASSAQTESSGGATTNFIHERHV
jgi:hypothetical protein